MAIELPKEKSLQKVYVQAYAYAYAYTKTLLALKGGQGSGNFGHEGRPGEVGGSGDGGGYTTYYRGEFSKLKDSITTKGIKGKVFNDRPKSVYMTKSYEDAHLYGVQKTDIGDSYVIVEIRVPNTEKILPDERDTKPVYGRFDAVRYEGNIPSDWIVSVSEYEITQDYEGMSEKDLAKLLATKNISNFYYHIILCKKSAG